jgi:hypothetical protein
VAGGTFLAGDVRFAGGLPCRRLEAIRTSDIPWLQIFPNAQTNAPIAPRLCAKQPGNFLLGHVSYLFS